MSELLGAATAKTAWLYHWPDGWKLGRKLGIHPVQGRPGNSWWELRDPSGNYLTMSLPGLGQQDTTRDDYTADWLRLVIEDWPGRRYRTDQLTVEQANLWRPRLLAFVLDLLAPPTFDPFFGPVTANFPRWFGVPVFVRDEVWQRMDNPEIEARIQALWRDWERTWKEREPQAGSSGGTPEAQAELQAALDEIMEPLRELWMTFLVESLGGVGLHGLPDANPQVEARRLEEGIPSFITPDSDDVPFGWQLDGGVEPYARFYLLGDMDIASSGVKHGAPSRDVFLWNLSRVEGGDHLWTLKGNDIDPRHNTLLSVWNELTWMTYRERNERYLPGREGGGSPISPKTLGWSVRWKSTEAAWWAENMMPGELVYDPSVFWALNATPPHLQPQPLFEQWWAQVKAST